MTELTILMPCLNEAETLEICIRKAKQFLEDNRVDGEIVIADNGSVDGSQDIATSLGARVVPVPERGYGAALIAGIESANGRYVIMGDSDDSYDFLRLEGFLEKLRAGSDLVMGNRFEGGIATGAMPLLHRYLGNPVLSAVGRIFYQVPVKDFHCGLRGFSREAILGLKLTQPGMEFASEMVVKASIAGLRIEEVPTTLAADGRTRPPHLRSWPDGWRHLKLLLTFAPNWLFYYPGLGLLMFGALIYAVLLTGPLTIGSVTFDVATLIFSSAMILVGSQMVSFYFLARIHSVNSGLLPKTARFVWLSKMLSVDRCCQIGGIFLLAGAISTVWSIVIWSNAGWGDLSAGAIVRPSSFVVLSAALGVQCIMVGFLGGFLGLGSTDIVEDADQVDQLPLAENG